MPIGDDRDAIQLTRKEWDCLNETIEEINDKLDKVLMKLFGDPSVKGDGGMYDEHKILWEEHKENEFWKSKKVAVASSIMGLLSFIGAVIAIILSSRQL